IQRGSRSAKFSPKGDQQRRDESNGVTIDAPRPLNQLTIQSLNRRNRTMLSWAITFLIIALIAAVLGFGGVAGTAAWIAKVLFVVFLILFVVALMTGRRTTV